MLLLVPGEAGGANPGVRNCRLNRLTGERGLGFESKNTPLDHCSPNAFERNGRTIRNDFIFGGLASQDSQTISNVDRKKVADVE